MNIIDDFTIRFAIAVFSMGTFVLLAVLFFGKFERDFKSKR